MSQLEQLRQRMQELGVQAKRSLGQNFLISDYVIESILQAVGQSSAEILIEIGPGLGALTDRLIKTNKPLRLIELDQRFASYWRKRDCDVVEVDALQFDWRSIKNAQHLLVSNLPYQISSSIVMEMSLHQDFMCEMILMFQKEVAQRIQAKPRSEHYGLLSVIAQCFWQIEKICEARPQDFYPAPKVASRVLKFRRHNQFNIRDSLKFLNFVKGAFAHRRKMLKKNLLSLSLNEVQIESAFSSLDIGAQVRAEELTLAQWANLFKEFYGSKS